MSLLSDAKPPCFSLGLLTSATAFAIPSTSQLCSSDWSRITYRMAKSLPETHGLSNWLAQFSRNMDRSYTNLLQLSQWMDLHNQRRQNCRIENLLFPNTGRKSQCSTGAWTCWRRKVWMIWKKVINPGDIAKEKAENPLITSPPFGQVSIDPAEVKLLSSSHPRHFCMQFCTLPRYMTCPSSDLTYPSLFPEYTWQLCTQR